jgi:N-acetylmuramoyl-L-alanine amidase
LHKTADNLAVAKRENSSILLEKDYQTNYDGFDPNSPEANIIFSLYQNTFINQSLQFASLGSEAV